MRNWFLACVAVGALCGCYTAPSDTDPAQAGVVQVAQPSSPDFSTAYLLGKFDPDTHPDFVTVRPEHASKTGMRLRKDAYAAFVKMYDAAKAEGITLKIISATRPFAHQKTIWEAKWDGSRTVEGEHLPTTTPDPTARALKILRYSSMPGSSRHHWGTDMDLNDLNNAYFATGTGKKIYTWLTTHAHQYGFCQPYTPKGTARPHGYEEEKWHWSYMPIATALTRQYDQKIQDTDIQGFKGAETARTIGIKAKYVLGVNAACK